MKFVYVTLFLICFYKSSSQDVNFGRIAYYPFNGTANDHIGNNDASVHGASLYSDRFGNVNSAYSLDGVDDFIEIPHDPLLNFGANEDFSIVLWVKVANVQNDMGGTNSGILGKWNEITTSSYPYAIRYWNINESTSRQEKIFALRYDSQGCGNNPMVTSPCKLTSEKWHQIVLRKKGNEIAYFQDRILQGVEQDNTSLTCGTKNSFPILIGKRNFDQRYFTGIIDDISFYNRAITNDEIALLFTQNGWLGPPSDLEFISFSFTEQLEPATIIETMRTIDIKVACDTDVTNLVASFNLSNGAIASVNGLHQISEVNSNNFTQEVKYLITASDGCTAQEWTITVIKETLSQEEIDSQTAFQSFVVPGQLGQSAIDLNNHTIDLMVSCSADLSHLISSFSLPNGAIANISGVSQKSGVTSNNFSSPVIYTVNDIQGCSEQEWTITVTKEQLSQEEIDSETAFQSFIVSDQKSSSDINLAKHTIDIEVPCGKDLSKLVSDFSLPLGATAQVKGVLQTSGITSNDFTDTVIYHVFGRNECMIQKWSITVQQKSWEKVDYRSREFFLPNIITPNGDNLNDTFQIGTLLQNSGFSLYNIYGRKVYYDRYYKNDFSGSGLSPGVYYFTIKSRCVDKLIKGYLHIVKN